MSLIKILIKIYYNYFINRHSEHVAELFFLQSNGNMMEYPSWRKKPPVPQFIAFKKSYRLDPQATDDNEFIRVSKFKHLYFLICHCFIRKFLCLMTKCYACMVFNFHIHTYIPVVFGSIPIDGTDKNFISQ